MKIMKKISAALLALLALVALSVSSQAQTTNFMLYNFDTNQVAQKAGFAFGGSYQGWGNWFGGDFTSVTWDSTVDSSNNPSSGSMKAQVHMSGTDQYVLFDGFFSESLDMYNVFTNMSFDIKYDASSCTRTNADGTVDFGALRAGAFDPYSQDWFYYFSISATNGLGQPNTNWTHISIPINQSNTFTFWPNLVTIQGILVGMDVASGGNVINGLNVGGYPLSLAGAQSVAGNTNLHGTQTYWIDNIQFIGPAGGIIHPPPTLSVVKSTPALRAFIGSASIYARSQLTSVNANESWIGGPYPVTYSFTLLDFPNVSQVQAHLEVIPGPAYTGNTGADYGKTNCLWLQILSDGAGGYTAAVAWKTNAVNNNPNHTELSITKTNISPAGTWTLQFNSDTGGTLSGPGFSNMPFTIHDPNVIVNWQNPCELVIGNQPNGVTMGEGLPSDYSAISITGVAGGPIIDDFTTASSLDPAWTLLNCDNTNTVTIVTTNSPYWVNWNIPDVGFTLGVSTNVIPGPWILPDYYSGYYDSPVLSLQGKLNMGFDTFGLSADCEWSTADRAKAGAECILPALKSAAAGSTFIT